MSIIKYLLETKITMIGGEVITGAITTIDGEIYRFLSHIDEFNFYILLIRDGDGWHQCGGSEKYGKELPEKIGACIQLFMEENPSHAMRLNWL